jgi:hypothetical protein
MRRILDDGIQLYWTKSLDEIHNNQTTESSRFSTRKARFMAKEVQSPAAIPFF